MIRQRKGFTLIEMALSLAIMALISLALYRWSDSVADDTMVKQEYLNAYRFEAGIKDSMVAILDTFEGTCGNIASDATTSMAWGWGSSSCANTSPLPRRSGNNLIYDINLGSLSAGLQASLKNKIISAYAPMCRFSSSNTTSLTLSCGPTFTGFQYDTTSGLVNQYHTPGGTFNMLDTPTPVLTITRSYTQGSTTEAKTYRLNLSDVWQQRLAYSTMKMEAVAKMLKNQYNMKLAKEVSNTSPTGLNSVDDELIPWHWTAFGDNAATAATTVCSKNTSTGVCDNLNTNNIWRSTTGDALLWRRFITGLASGEYKYAVDGFGNPLRLYPIITQRNGATDLSTCTVTAPTSPREPYAISATVKPPYGSVIYNAVSSGGVNCANLSTQAPAACRYTIIY